MKTDFAAALTTIRTRYGPLQDGKFGAGGDSLPADRHLHGIPGSYENRCQLDLSPIGLFDRR
jgi:hypothetical protein